MYSNTLKHYGVVGMKWGVRKDKYRYGKHGRVGFRTDTDDYDDGDYSVGRHTPTGQAVRKAKEEGRYIDNNYDKNPLSAAERLALQNGERVVSDSGYRWTQSTSAGKTFIDGFSAEDFEDIIDLDDFDW